jgi:hypothetical protein
MKQESVGGRWAEKYEIVIHKTAYKFIKLKYCAVILPITDSDY